jgi:hypothetical protein
MKIVDKDSGEVYYDSGRGRVFKVASNFWQKLKNDQLKYRSGGNTEDIYYTTIQILSLKNPDFEKTFALMANTILGASAMDGDERAMHML